MPIAPGVTVSRSSPRSLGAAVALALLLPVAPSHAQVTLQIYNASGQPVCVMWTGTASLTGTTANGTAIANSDYGTANAAGYPLTDFASSQPNLYYIANFTMNGGRMWFTYGSSCWAFSNAGYTPAMANFNDPNFTTRYDKIEASITGSTDDNLDITAVDGFGIPFAVEAWQAANPTATVQRLAGSAGNQVRSALAAVAANAFAPAPIAPAGGTIPQISDASPYLVVNSNSQGTTTPSPYTNSPVNSTGTFVRVIANDSTITPYAGDPVVAANAGIPANYNWTDYESYVKRMDGRALVKYTGATNIVGAFAGLQTPTGPSTSAQSYNATATFDPTEQRTVQYTDPVLVAFSITFTGFVTIKGTTTVGSSAYSVEVKVPYGGPSQYINVQSGFSNPNQWLLSPSGVVGANANYLYKYYLTSSGDPGTYSQTNPFSGGPQNDIMTWMMGDLLAGMNVGAVGSTKTFASGITINGNAYPATTQVGAFNSQDWWSIGSTLRSAGESVYNYYFGYLQSETYLYNQYAEAVYPLTDAYGFAYSDRIAGGYPAISWNATLSNAIDTVTIEILPDAAAPPSFTDTVEAIEYHNKSLDHYFVTHDPAEMAALDAGMQIKGWRRTGYSFRVLKKAHDGTSTVCRLRIPPSLGDSHFYGRDAAECAATQAKHPGFEVEDGAFMHAFAPTAGACPASTTPVYRVFNNRGDANHRYTSNKTVRDQMVARGWIAEGDGPGRVTMCVPA
jgi:hypothetical protein